VKRLFVVVVLVVGLYSETGLSENQSENIITFATFEAEPLKGFATDWETHGDKDKARENYGTSADLTKSEAEADYDDFAPHPADTCSVRVISSQRIRVIIPSPGWEVVRGLLTVCHERCAYPDVWVSHPSPHHCRHHRHCRRHEVVHTSIDHAPKSWWFLRFVMPARA
jgi:hypothetical protein